MALLLRFWQAIKSAFIWFYRLIFTRKPKSPEFPDELIAAMQEGKVILMVMDRLGDVATQVADIADTSAAGMTILSNRITVVEKNQRIVELRIINDTLRRYDRHNFIRMFINVGIWSIIWVTIAKVAGWL
jgi:hypothetical protein